LLCGTLNGQHITVTINGLVKETPNMLEFFSLPYVYGLAKVRVIGKCLLSDKKKTKLGNLRVT